jgi:EAL domain-containing protein (putative c-di-GMP-specific phosphodiesterase class I)
VVVQPIVALPTGALVGVEALSRFPASSPSSPSTPDRWFAEHLPVIPGYVAMNASPMTVLSEEFPYPLRRLPLSRVLLELSEHEPIEDDEALRRVLAPLRASGLRLAIDDVGAGFSSLRHIVLTTPDVLKIDRSLVDGVSHDPVLRTLVKSLVEFGHGAGAADRRRGHRVGRGRRGAAVARRRLRPGLALRAPGPAELARATPGRGVGEVVAS